MQFIHPAIQEYIHNLNKKNDSNLDLLNNLGKKDQIPIVDHEVGKFLYLLVLMHKPQNILEIGFGGGYSCLWMAKALCDTGKITTLELNTDRIEQGKQFFKNLNLLSKVNILYVDAIKYLNETDNTYDFIFLDAIKRSYLSYLPLIIKVIKKGGVFLADNILFRGNVVKNDVGKKYEVGTSIINEFNNELAKSPYFETIFLPIGDGISFSVRI